VSYRTYQRPYLLMVDSGDEGEPGNRSFATLEAARRAYKRMPLRWARFAWIIERRPGQRNVTWMRDGNYMDGHE